MKTASADLLRDRADKFFALLDAFDVQFRPNDLIGREIRKSHPHDRTYTISAFGNEASISTRLGTDGNGDVVFEVQFSSGGPMTRNLHEQTAYLAAHQEMLAFGALLEAQMAEAVRLHFYSQASQRALMMVIMGLDPKDVAQSAKAEDDAS